MFTRALHIRKDREAMTIGRLYVVVCSVPTCPEVFMGDGKAKSDLARLRLDARLDGWWSDINTGLDLCPDHADALRMKRIHDYRESLRAGYGQLIDVRNIVR